MRRINLLLQVIAITCVIGAVLSLTLGLAMPIETHTAAAPLQMPVPLASHSPPLPALDSFSPIFARSLQSPLGAPEAAASAQVASSAAEPDVPVSQLVLVGTIGNSLALIKGPDGTVAMIEPGDDVNGDPVLAIRPSQVDLRIDGKVTTLHMAPPPDDGVVTPSK